MKSSKAQAAVLAVVAFLAFANSLGGEFVYDDNRQILMNPLIQQPDLYGKALTSDVWAFKGDDTVSASNYYRPVFVLWLILNFAVFGAHPFGWHLLNVVLHIVVCLLSLTLLKRLGFSPAVSFVLSILFAIHPAHVENVSWISGSPDVLLSVGFLSSLLILCDSRKRAWWAYAISILLYVLALGSKEIAMMLFPLFFFVFRSLARDDSSGGAISDREALKLTAPFALIAVMFFAARWYTLGVVSHSLDDAPSVWESILSVPSVFLFYLRQAVFPAFLAENHPLRPETALSLGFFLSAIGAAAVVLFAWWICRKNAVRAFGALLFFLPLLPVLFVRSFPTEQIVHDRYLYLPLLGLLIVVGSMIPELVPSDMRFRKVATAAVVLIILLLGTQTVIYNRVWANSFDLWEYNVKADPNSAASAANYGAELSGRGRYVDAISAYDHSLAILKTPLALMGRARNLIALGRYDEAIDDTRKIIELPNEEANAYILYQAYETAAIAYTSSNRFGEAEKIVRDARERLPIYRAALTDKLAIILYNQGKKDDALNELNSVRDQARRELLPASKAVFLRLGVLEAEKGDTAAAKRDLQEFLSASATFTDSESINLRRQAVAALARRR